MSKGKYNIQAMKALARESGKPDSQIASQPDNQKAIKPEKQVNLCTKVPESWRRHWAAEAKRTGITMTEVMVNALKEQFGLPDDQITR